MKEIQQTMEEKLKIKAWSLIMSFSSPINESLG